MSLQDVADVAAQLPTWGVPPALQDTLMAYVRTQQRELRRMAALLDACPADAPARAPRVAPASPMHSATPPP